MNITTHEENSISIVSLSGRMDASTTNDFENACNVLLQADKIKLLIDMNELEYISSAGLRGILTIVKRIKQKQGQIAFCALQNMVSEVFKVSGFTSMLSIYNNKDEALLVMSEA